MDFVDAYEAQACIQYLSCLRTLRKVGGYGTIVAHMDDGRVVKHETLWVLHGSTSTV